MDRSSLTRRAFVATATVSAASLAALPEEPFVSEVSSAQIGSIKAVRADFSRLVDYPITKTKFAIFNSCIVPRSTYERDAAFFAIAKPESLRIDLGWGTDWAGWSTQPIAGTADAPLLQLEEMDAIAQILNDAGVLPYWSYCYTPSPLQDPPGDWRSLPGDLKENARILGLVAEHYRLLRGSNPVGYHEVFNEPDNDDFTVMTMADYFEMYETGSVAIRANDPEGLVGGPALAFTYSWIDPFVDLVVDKNLPLDFFSTHIYGTGDAFQGLDRMLDASRDSLDRYPQLDTVEIHLNEFNSYVIDYPIDGTQQKHRLAAAFLRDMAHFLARPEVTLVHWAQFLDSGSGNFSGMISIDGHRKAVFNAAEIYARLPVDRVSLDLDASLDFGGMAGVDDHRAGFVIWNLAPGKQDVEIDLAGIPFSRGTIREFRIDSDYSSWGDDTQVEDLEQTRIEEGTGLSGATWTATVSGGGVLYLEIDNEDAGPEPAIAPIGRWIRNHRYYPDRTTTAWSDFDKTTWTFRLGSAQDASADLEIGVTAENVVDGIGVWLEVTGTPQFSDAESLLALRVDYFDGVAYTHSVLLHGPVNGGADVYSAERTAMLPWGTGSMPDEIVGVSDLNEFVLRPADHAPASWNGRVLISAIMHNVGTDILLKARLRPA